MKSFFRVYFILFFFLLLFLFSDQKIYAGPGCANGCAANEECCSYFWYDENGTLWVSYGCCGPSCFPAGTEVEMRDGGVKNIEDVEVGDSVISRSEDGLESVSTVTALDQPVRNHMCRISFTDGQSLRLTDEHPLYTQEGWKAINPDNSKKEVPNLAVEQLEKGDKLIKSDGSEKEVDDYSCWSQKIQTYNLILDGGVNTYFANGFLAHNKVDNSGCGWGNYSYKWQKARGIGTSCVPCWSEGGNPYIPRNVAINYEESIGALVVTWDGFGYSLYHTLDYQVEWTTNPDNWYLCNPLWSLNPCSVSEMISDNGSGVNNHYEIPVSSPTDQVYIKVEAVQYHTYRQEGANIAWVSSTYNFEDCPSYSVPVFYPPVCSLTPESVSLEGGESATLTMNIYGGSVDRVEFESGNTGVASATSPDASSPYTSVVGAVGGGNTTITGRTYIGSTNVCTDTSTITVLNTLEPWWQVKNGDIISDGTISSNVPSGNVFIDDGDGGYPGVAIYSTNLYTNSNPVSSKLWSAQSATNFSRLFDYSYFANLVPEDIVFSNPETVSLETGGGAQYGYYWYKAESGYTLNSDVNLGNRKVILFVEGGNLNINGKINLNDGNGFFFAIVNEDINVGADVAGSPALEGFFLSSGNFSTGLGTNQLHIRGSVASLSNINLQRSPAVNTNPAELFEYAPDLTLLFPSKLSQRKTRWSEVAP